jgi:LAO/AO transport system kinase
VTATGVDALADAVVAGDRRALARAITLVESTRTDHRADAVALQNALLPRTGSAIRIGISGAPGAGKSTFIEAFGVHLVDHGRTVAVLAVDPSSTRSGGSILGDKTRMAELARHPNAYVRPSPSGGSLGGVARRTREAMLVCEAAGFDTVMVETVGVGQSETEVDGMVDVFVLLVAPAGGDELQGIKKGVTELADLVVVTKADGDLEGPARQAAADYRHALHLLRPKHEAWTPEVMLCSALTGEGVEAVWTAIARHHDALSGSGQLDARRVGQRVEWMWATVRQRLVDEVMRDTRTRSVSAELEQQVAAGRLSPEGAAAELLAAYRPHPTGDASGS